MSESRVSRLARWTRRAAVAALTAAGLVAPPGLPPRPAAPNPGARR